MKISLNEIKKYVKVPEEMSTDELVKLIGSRLVEVEGTEDLAPKYEGVTVVKVVECEKIPDTHLSLCQIDAGGEELIQVVCGAPNVRAGMLAAWIQPGAIVPETYGGENFKLSVRKLRGHESNGMLAAADELALGDAHDGIIEIDPKMARSGDSFREVFGLDDVILDIENKSLTHRPDCFGIIGFAREVAGILGEKFVEPEIVAHEGVDEKSDSKVTVEIQDAEICGRYSCAVIEVDDATAKNKYFTRDDVFLAKAGMRGISKVVDVTNILMLLTGQPLHAFDYDKFVKVGGEKYAKVGVRTAEAGEKLQLLDGKTVECDKNDILITSGEIPVALAGAMGGLETEVDETTKRILLESATFSLYHLRKTQMKHGIFSEAITRFTKGQPAYQTVAVLDKAVAQLEGKVLAEADVWAGEAGASQMVKVTVAQINALLGTDYSVTKCCKTLENVGFVVTEKAGELAVEVPAWRTDIHIKEDVIEEIGRLNGFDNIPRTLAVRPFVGAKLDPMLQLKKELRGILAERLRAHEVLTYSFVSKDLQEKVGEDSEKSYKIVNSISPELQRFRQSITPSLLEKVYENLKAGYKDFALFEMNQVTNRELGLDEDGVPVIENHLAVVTVGDYYRAKAMLESTMHELRLSKVVVTKLAEGEGLPCLEPRRAATVKMGDEKVGCVGELKNSVRRALKIEPTVAVFEVNLDKMIECNASAENRPNVEISKFPMVDRDVTVQVASDVEFTTVKAAIVEALAKEEKLIYSVKDVAIFRKLREVKNLTFHLEFAHTEKTLTAEEIRVIMKRVEKSLMKVEGKVI